MEVSCQLYCCFSDDKVVEKIPHKICSHLFPLNTKQAVEAMFSMDDTAKRGD